MCDTFGCISMIFILFLLNVYESLWFILILSALVLRGYLL